jgi:hypothetical protein
MLDVQELLVQKTRRSNDENRFSQHHKEKV